MSQEYIIEIILSKLLYDIKKIQSISIIILKFTSKNIIKYPNQNFNQNYT